MFRLVTNSSVSRNSSLLFFARRVSVARVSLSTAAASEQPKVIEGHGVFEKIACIGTGKMAEAIIKPLVEKGVQPPDKFHVFDVSEKSMEDANEKFGVQTAPSIPELLNDADLVLCCVKPQNLTPAFFNEMRKGKIKNDSILLSIVAGKAQDVFLEAGFAKIVRSMPNTPAMIGQGMTVWSCTPNLTQDERKKIRTILSSCGKSVCANKHCVVAYQEETTVPTLHSHHIYSLSLDRCTSTTNPI